MTVILTLTIAGSDSGPFNLYSNTDGYITPFNIGVTKLALEGGYTTSLVPDGTTIVKIQSTGNCNTSVNIILTGGTTTTTTTTLAPVTQDILLGYSSLGSTEACTNIATPVTRYIPSGQDWMVVTFLYQDATGTIPANPGFYSDGAKWYFWDGSTFTSTAFC